MLMNSRKLLWDKKLHFFTGWLPAAVSAVLGWGAIGVYLAVVVAWQKEERDFLDPMHHCAEFDDFAATVLGALVGAQLPTIF